MLQSLEHQSGLPLAFDPKTNAIHWTEGISVGRMSVRAFSEMKKYISDAGAEATGDAVYAVWRRLGRREDEAVIESSHLRYDITVIPSGYFLGQRKEFFRTAGHYHPLKPGTNISHAEVFEVVSGRAYWLMQRLRPDNPAAIEEIYAIEAGPGEKAVMLPGFGHISANAYDEPLITANWISDASQYDYEPYREFRGGGYWLMEGPGADAIEFEKNANYSEVPELKKLRPREVPEFGFLRSKPLYSLVHDSQKLRFLNNPEEFTHILTLDRCYRLVV